MYLNLQITKYSKFEKKQLVKFFSKDSFVQQ